ncbi:MAG: hypothetical protein ABFD69_03885 [Candidatus Sumerlaeia bacterium]
MKNRLLLPVFLLFCSSSFAFDPASLPARCPDEPTTYTYYRRFSFESAMESVRYVAGWLDKFRVTVDDLEKRLPPKEFADMKLPGWEYRYLAFGNRAMALEGTLLKQNYEIKKLEYELALERFNQKKVSAGELDLKKNALDKAEQDFLKYWNQLSFAD